MLLFDNSDSWREAWYAIKQRKYTKPSNLCSNFLIINERNIIFDYFSHYKFVNYSFIHLLFTNVINTGKLNFNAIGVHGFW